MVALDTRGTPFRNEPTTMRRWIFRGHGSFSQDGSLNPNASCSGRRRHRGVLLDEVALGGGQLERPRGGESQIEIGR